MKTKYFIILIAFSVSNIFAQTDNLTFNKDIENLNKKASLLENKIEIILTSNTKILQEHKSLRTSQFALKKKFYKLNDSFEIYKQNTEKEIDSLQQAINSNNSNIKKTADELNVKIEDTHKFTNQSITDLNKTVSQNTLYWIIAILVVALLVLLVFILLRKQIFKQKTDLDSNLQDTKKVLEEEGIKLDTKLAEMLEKQLIIINEERAKETKTSTSEIDHSLVLKVADRLISMEKNISRMDEKTKGLKNLKKAILSIKDNFALNDYEIVEMIGKKYDERIIATVTYNPDSEEPAGLITKIFIPQVNYKDVMIQSAQIEVSE